jgi:hypothetical protein
VERICFINSDRETVANTACFKTLLFITNTCSVLFFISRFLEMNICILFQDSHIICSTRYRRITSRSMESSPSRLNSFTSSMKRSSSYENRPTPQTSRKVPLLQKQQQQEHNELMSIRVH